MSSSEEWEQFTEAGFRKILLCLKEMNYRFATYENIDEDRHVIWRHDVDFSMHRAIKLAHIESTEKIQATYFVNPHSEFYNLLEPETSQILQELLLLGHKVGLHFDSSAWPIASWTEVTLNEALGKEKALLEVIAQTPIHSVSWHNPDQSNLLEFDADTIAGMKNAYAARLRRDYAYCSDSNGYWRFRSMIDVIKDGHQRLHLLTHPEWWTPNAMSPSARVDRAIQGRASALRRRYDAFLEKAGRKNVK